MAALRAADASIQRQLRRQLDKIVRTYACTLSHTRAHSSAAAAGSKLVLGSGSNVIDLFYPLRQLPKPGDKQYFALEKILADSVVGGVTLNHLAWAQALGAPTGLLALQGTDEHGQTIRKKMQAMGMATEFVRVSDAYSTSVSFVFNDPSGERTIIMAKASTAQLTGDKMAKEYNEAIARACMITTEISQLPLSGVQWLLTSARARGIPSLVDVDVPPSIAAGAAQLGSTDELRRCLQSADVLKFTASAADESLALVSKTRLESKLENVAAQLADAFGAKVCVVTDGSRGSALALSKQYAADVAGGRSAAVTIPSFPGVTQRDATGAGDAFFGGIVAAFHYHGLPRSGDDLVRAGRIAAAAGAACVEVVGALPVAGVSPKRMVDLCKDCEPLIKASSLSKQVGLDAPPAVTAATPPATGAAPVGAGSHALQSMQEDAQVCSTLLAAYAQDPHAVQRAFATLIAELMRCTRPDRASGKVVQPGHVYVSGIGKSGAVAARLSISLRSVGVAASYVHGCEWHHGDLGAAGPGDVLITLSHSGRSAELLDVTRRLTARGVFSCAITSSADSPLAKAAGLHLLAPAPAELLDTIPTRSVVSQEVIVNAIVSEVVHATGLTREGFKLHHPGGAIGAAR